MFRILRKFISNNNLRFYSDFNKAVVSDFNSILPKVQVAKSTESSDVIQKVNNHIKNNPTDRLFAVVQICGKQFKITDNDLIIIEGSFPPTIGDRLKLEKILCVGGKFFSLIGRPLIQNDLVDIHATIIEKTLSHTKIVFKKIRRKQYMRTNFYRIERTMIRINSIRIKPEVNEPSDVTFLPERV